MAGDRAVDGKVLHGMQMWIPKARPTLELWSRGGLWIRRVSVLLCCPFLEEKLLVAQVHVPKLSVILWYVCDMHRVLCFSGL